MLRFVSSVASDSQLYTTREKAPQARRGQRAEGEPRQSGRQARRATGKQMREERKRDVVKERVEKEERRRRERKRKEEEVREEEMDVSGNKASRWGLCLVVRFRSFSIKGVSGFPSCGRRGSERLPAPTPDHSEPRLQPFSTLTSQLY